MKKMMISTALATSLIAGVASAETKIGAYIETTLGSGETPNTSAQVNQGTSIGYEHGVSFSGSKELDNGMTLETYFGIEDGAAADAKGISFVNGNTKVMIEADVNTIDDKQSVPVIANAIEDGNKGLSVAYNANALTIHAMNGIGLRQKTDYGTFGVKYVPKVVATNFNDSNPSATEKTGSGLAIGFQGSLGVDGLGVNVAKTTRAVDGNSATESEQMIVGANYNFGNITVGVQQTTYDNVTGASRTYSNGKSQDHTSYGATMAVSDQFSVGIQYAEVDGDGITTNEEITSLTAGYNLGGATISLQMTEVENHDGTAGSDGEAIELRVKQSF